MITLISARSGSRRLAAVTAVLICATVLGAPLLCSDTDPEKRLEEIERQIEKAAKEGTPLPWD